MQPDLIVRLLLKHKAMIIKKVQHERESKPKNATPTFNRREMHLVTTWYFLFIPIFVSKVLIDRNFCKTY